MKLISKLLVLIFGLTALTATTQNADSVIVVYDNQKTIVPLPAFGSQTSVSYADSNKVVEIGVWLRKPGEISTFPQYSSNNLTIEKPENKSKWFSQVEAGYIIEFSKSEGNQIYTVIDDHIPITFTDNFSIDNRKGYQIRLSLQQKESYLNKNFSFVSAFKLGFAQSFLKSKVTGTESDSTGNLISTYDNTSLFRINSIQLIYQFGFSYHFTTGKLPARIDIGNCVGISRFSIKNKNSNQPASNGLLETTLLQPYLSLEIERIGIVFSADMNVPFNNYDISYTNLGRSMGISLTYRIF